MHNGEHDRGGALVGAEPNSSANGSLNSHSLTAPNPTVYVVVELDFERIAEEEAARAFPTHRPMGVPASNAAPDGMPWRMLTEEQREERFYRHRQKHWCAICRERIPRRHYPGVGFRHTSSAVPPCNCHLCLDCAELWDHPKCPRCANNMMAYGHIFWLVWPNGVARLMPQPDGTHQPISDEVQRFRFVWPPPRDSPWEPWQPVRGPADD